jgi:alpha-L-rhamnosidase
MLFPKEFYCATKEYSTYEKHIPAPIFRKSFTMETKPEKAEILISGIGFYDLFINGQKITKGYLAPYISNTDDLVYFDHYDLTPYLIHGENVIGVMLGTGMQNCITACWNFNDAIFRSSPKFALFLVRCAGIKQ